MPPSAAIAAEGGFCTRRRLTEGVAGGCSVTVCGADSLGCGNRAFKIRDVDIRSKTFFHNCLYFFFFRVIIHLPNKSNNYQPRD